MKNNNREVAKKTSARAMLFVACFGLGYVVSSVPTAWGDSKNPEDNKPEKVRTGVIASRGEVSARGAAVNATFSDAPGEASSAIGGSLQQKSPGRCEAVIVNNAQKTSYSVAFAVKGTGATGAQVFRKTYTATVSPKQTVKKEFDCAEGVSTQLELTSAKPLK